MGLGKHGLTEFPHPMSQNKPFFFQRDFFPGVLSQEKDVKNLEKKPAILYGFYFRVIQTSIKDGNN